MQQGGDYLGLLAQRGKAGKKTSDMLDFIVSVI